MGVRPGGTRDEAQDGPLPPELALLWPGASAPRRGPRPGLTVGGIAAAAVVIADAEGLDAVSMARVAQSLDVTTMALYRYVPGKQDLLALMYDLALGPVPSDPDPSAPLRARLESWCADQLRVLHAHPWIPDVPTLPRLGPSQLAWLERGLTTLAGTPLDHGERTEVIGVLSLHVLSEGRMIGELARQRRRAEALAAGGTPSGPDVAHPAMLDYGGLLRRLATPDAHPAITAALAAGGFENPPVDDGEPVDDGGLGSGLSFMLDGIEQHVARAAEARAGRRPAQEEDA